jgi:O-methyltransferase
MDEASVSAEFGQEFLTFWKIIAPYTIVSVERAYATYRACRYVARYGILGCFAECGVFKGGMSMLAALTFTAHDKGERDIWLYDTFAGMTAPAVEDGEAAAAYNRQIVASSLQEVQRNFGSIDYPGRSHFVEGDVCETLKQSANVPKAIAVLRLDTDWYESTKAELDILYEKVAPRGVVLCDDYGYWQGARKAVDEFIDGLPHPVYLCRTDNCGVEFVKTS